jgi:hypothetical protein
MSGATLNGKATLEDVARWTAILTGHGGAVEVRSFLRGRPSSRVFPPGTDSRKIASHALALGAKGAAVYFTLNPIRAELAGGGAAADADVERRFWLLVDVDPRRPADTGATADEKRRARLLIDAIRAELRRRGWPDGILADSGNGWHLLYRVDLPNDDDATATVKAALAALARRFNTPAADVDTVVYNASRITKFYGTAARKGQDTPERPHRPSALLKLPEALEPVPPELLADLAREAAPAPAPPVAPPPAPPPGGRPADTGNPAARFRAYLDTMDPAISGNRGHNAAFRAACKAVEFGLAEDEALRLFLEVYNPRCQPPWTEAEARHKIADAYRENAGKFGAKLAEGRNGHHGGNGHPHPAAADGVAGQAKPPRSEPPTFDAPPRPLAADLLPVPPLDPRLIPEAFRDWLADIARRGCLPIEYPAAAAIVAAASLIGSKVVIRPKRHDDWVVAANLWGGAVGWPGVLKTPGVEEGLRPLKRLAAAAQDRHRVAMKRHAEDAEILAAKSARAKELLKAAVKAGDRPEAELRELAAEAVAKPEDQAPQLRRYLINDATVEKLGELLNENPHGLLQYRDELAGFFRSMDRQGHESDRGFYLEAWNGLGSYAYDRIGRGTVLIPRVTLSVFGSIQPGPLARYLKGAGGGDEADGFMPRFQLLVYPDPPARFVNVDAAPDPAAKARAFRVFERLDELDPEALGCPVDEGRGLPCLGFDAEAQVLFDGWRTELEERLRAHEDAPALVCHLAKYRSLMPSLALVFHLIDAADRPSLAPITAEAAWRAAAWCDLLEAHARRIYQSAMDGDPDAAGRLAERIKQTLPNPFTYRDVYRKGWSGLTGTEDVRRAVGLLEDRGWVKVVEVEPTERGGPRTEHVYIHPNLLAGRQAEDGPP